MRLDVEKMREKLWDLSILQCLTSHWSCISKENGEKETVI